MIRQYLGASIAILLGIAVIVFGLVTFYTTTQESKLSDLRDTRMDAYSLAKTKAESVVDVLRIANQEDYDKIRGRLRGTLTDDLFDEYFPTEKYQGTGYKLGVSKTNVVGEILDKNSFIFKMDVSVNTGAVINTVTMLIKVDGGIVTSIESLG